MSIATNTGHPSWPNVERDRRNAELPRAEGWRIETIWECEARRPEALAARLERIAAGARLAGAGRQETPVEFRVDIAEVA